eukprot:625134-Rhodomonas_salina.1
MRLAAISRHCQENLQQGGGLTEHEGKGSGVALEDGVVNHLVAAEPSSAPYTAENGWVPVGRLRCAIVFQRS